ncbi:glucosamine-6-phosphate deaminase [Microbulbifer elongatus]|uniref:glucosamine-6-phosphate deaminase n=1 Tax=Microbulbifer elongatus TaxID=86173 RepID=UPI001CFF2620|nr:glucosamine-6-phosphate deaminase [Microbulbifer elongatus]
MRVQILDTASEMAVCAARDGAAAIRAAIRDRGEATIVLATGASQLEMLEVLTREAIDWSRVTAFHLDEYCGIDREHPVSFRRYMRERFTDRVAGLKSFTWIDADAEDLDAELIRLGSAIERAPVDVAFIGIGENGHLAFNEPPADFHATSPYILVTLDEVSRQQQVNEGWFEHIDEVPKTAISMSLRQILKAKSIICTVPDARKAKAVQAALEGEIGRTCPASILRVHPDVALYLDKPAASDLQFFFRF